MQKHITAAFNAGQFIEGYIRGDYGKLSGQDVLQTKGAELGAMTIPVAKVVDKIQTKLENPQLTMAEFNRKLITIYATPEGKDLLGFNPASKDADDVQKKILLLDATLGKMSVSGTKGPGKEVISLDQAILNSLSTMTVPNSFLGIPYTSKTKDYLISTMTPAQKEAFAIERRKKAGKTSWTKEDIQNDVRLLNKSYTKTGVKSAATDEDEE